MPGFIDIVSFPTDDGALHQVYANVHEDTSSKLSLDFDRAHLRLLLLSLRNRYEEVRRRAGRAPYDVTLGVIKHPPLDGDSMALALVITEHIASFYGANPTQNDGSLALNGIPQIIATGNIDQNGIVHTVGGMDAKLTGILDAIASGSLKPGGLFIYPVAAKSSNVARLTCKLEAKGWRSLAVSHIDDVVPLWQPVRRQAKPEKGVWAHWKRPLILGAVAAVTLAVIVILMVDTPSEGELVNDTYTGSSPEPCAGLATTSDDAYRNCLVADGISGTPEK